VREQACALRRELVPVGVGAAHDGGEHVERRILDGEVLDQRVEAAALAAMRDVRARDVVRHRGATLGFLEHLRRRHVVEGRERIDEAADEPGTGDAVDLRALARDPARPAGHFPLGPARHGGESLRHASLRCLARGTTRRSRLQASLRAASWLTSWPRTQ
jgi:hypothetical protein